MALLGPLERCEEHNFESRIAKCPYCHPQSAKSLEELLERSYKPPKLFIFEEVEIGCGYHTLDIACSAREERDWSEPYKKSSNAEYRSRVVLVPFPPSKDVVTTGSAGGNGSPDVTMTSGVYGGVGGGGAGGPR